MSTTTAADGLPGSRVHVDGPGTVLSAAPQDAALVARWQVDARFGHKDAALALMREWWRDIAPRIGWDSAHARVLSGSLGVQESVIQVEVGLPSLSALDEAWSRLGRNPEQAQWAQALAPHVVSGTPRWSVYRIT